MKTLTRLWVIVVLMLGFTLHSFAQGGIDQFFSQYQDDDRFSRVKVSSRMFDLFLEIELDDPEEQEFVDIISKLDGLKVLIGDGISEANSLFTEMVAQTESNMDELMVVSETDQEFRFYVREANGKIAELVMVGHEQQNVMMMSLTGDIDLKQIAKLSQKMDIEGFENFKNVHPE